MKKNTEENEETTKPVLPVENTDGSLSDEIPAEETEASQIEKMKTEITTLNDKFLRLYSEFENYKKRVSRERTEYVKMAGSDVVLSMLPVLDDFERAMKSIGESAEYDSVKEGINLIYNKFKSSLLQKGLSEMKSNGELFDSELHEAVATAPSPTDDMKGKVLEELEKGYFLNGKVIRHAKVLVGS